MHSNEISFKTIVARLGRIISVAESTSEESLSVSSQHLNQDSFNELQREVIDCFNIGGRSEFIFHNINSWPTWGEVALAVRDVVIKFYPAEKIDIKRLTITFSQANQWMDATLDAMNAVVKNNHLKQDIASDPVQPTIEHKLPEEKNLRSPSVEPNSEGMMLIDALNSITLALKSYNDHDIDPDTIDLAISKKEFLDIRKNIFNAFELDDQYQEFKGDVLFAHASMIANTVKAVTGTLYPKDFINKTKGKVFLSKDDLKEWRKHLLWGIDRCARD